MKIVQTTFEMFPTRKGMFHFLIELIEIYQLYAEDIYYNVS